MPPPSLPNYLRAHRNRLALSQIEMAKLLGFENGTAVCRYENFVREPGLRTVLAMEIIFESHAQQIFAGVYAQIGFEIACRAKELQKSLKAEKFDARIDHARQVLARLSRTEFDDSF